MSETNTHKTETAVGVARAAGLLLGVAVVAGQVAASAPGSLGPVPFGPAFPGVGSSETTAGTTARNDDNGAGVTAETPASPEPVADQAPTANPLGQAVTPGRSDRPIGAPAPATEADPGSGEQDAGAGGKWMSDTAIALLAVLAVVGVLLVGFRTVLGGSGGGLGGRAPSPSGVLEILGRYPVGRGVSLILLRMDRRVLLISQSSGGRLGASTMTTLAELADPEDVASVLTKIRDADGESLSERFREMLRGYDASHENRVPEAGVGREVDVREDEASIRVLSDRLGRGGRG